MHIVYHCVEGCHCSATAAAIHLNYLPIDSKPSYHDLLNVPYFNNLSNVDTGKILLRGNDEYGNKVYTLCRKHVPHIVLPTVLDLWENMGGQRNDLMLVNTQHYENRFMKFGNLMSRKLNFKGVGKPLAAKATLYSYDQIAEVVKETKNKLH